VGATKARSGSTHGKLAFMEAEAIPGGEKGLNETAN